MVVLAVTSTLTLFFCSIVFSRLFSLKMTGVDVKKGRGLTVKKKYFSHIHIFRTNIHMYKNKRYLIKYWLSPFQSCITLNC